MSAYLFSGSYASAEEQAIKLWRIDEHTGKITKLAGIAGIERPSFIAIHPDGSHFAAVSEVEEGELVSYRWDRTSNTLTEVSRQKSNGDHPAHVCIDAAGEWVLSVNYSGGNVSVYPFMDDGTIGDCTDSVKHEGSGPNKERQDAPHPHSVHQVPRTDQFIVPDLGTDTIHIYELNRASGKLKLQHKVKAAEGSGPRHLAFHPKEPFVYCLGELDSSVTVYELDAKEGLAQRQTVSLLPEPFDGQNTSAEVAVSQDGRFLYASNRGRDSIVSFSIKEGLLEFLAETPSGGSGPRHFTIFPNSRWLIAANENSDSLAILAVDETGVPQKPEKTVETKAPVCVKLINRRENNEVTQSVYA